MVSVGISFGTLLFNLELEDYYLECCGVFHFVLQGAEANLDAIPGVFMVAVVHQNRDHINLVYSRGLLNFGNYSAVS